MNTTLRTVAFIGVGNMGAPMARRARRAGFELIVCDRNEAVLEAFARAGAAVTTDVAACAGADAVVVLLANDAQIMETMLGEGGLVTNPEPVTASEDFAFFLEKVPGCYINIGNGVGSQGGCMVHNAAYDFNDAVLSTGATYWVKLAERWLAPGAVDVAGSGRQG